DPQQRRPRWRRRNRAPRRDFAAAERRRARPKKRHVESMTPFPTKRMATACWAFIVVNTPRAQAAPGLDFSTLQGANTNSIHRLSTNGCGRPGGNYRTPRRPPQSLRNPLIEAARNGVSRRFERQLASAYNYCLTGLTITNR